MWTATKGRFGGVFGRNTYPDHSKRCWRLSNRRGKVEIRHSPHAATRRQEQEACRSSSSAIWEEKNNDRTVKKSHFRHSASTQLRRFSADRADAIRPLQWPNARVTRLHGATKLQTFQKTPCRKSPDRVLPISRGSADTLPSFQDTLPECTNDDRKSGIPGQSTCH